MTVAFALRFLQMPHVALSVALHFNRNYIFVCLDTESGDIFSLFIEAAVYCVVSSLFIVTPIVCGFWLTSWLSFVMSYCKIVTFPLVSWVRCGA